VAFRHAGLAVLELSDRHLVPSVDLGCVPRPIGQFRLRPCLPILTIRLPKILVYLVLCNNQCISFVAIDHFVALSSYFVTSIDDVEFALIET
jgi:hypothetical protein